MERKMKRMWLFALSTSGFFLPAFAEWHVDVVDLEGYTGICPSINLDVSDNPRVAYGGPNGYAKYAEYDGSFWTVENIFQQSYGSCAWFGIVTDDDGKSHVSFNGDCLRYAVQDNVSRSWTVESLASMHGTCTSIGLDSQGTPWIVYFDDNAGNWFVYYNGTGWTSELIDEGYYWWSWNSLVIDGADRAHVAYTTDFISTGVKYAVRNAPDQWDTMFVDSTMSTVPQGVSLALDCNGSPGISYNVEGELRYAAWNGSSWGIEIIDGIDTGPHQYGTSLAYDIWGHPHIAFCNSAGDSLLYTVNQGTGWQTESIYSPGAGDPDLILDSMGRPHIAFNNGSSLLYAFNDEPLSVESHEGSPMISAVYVSPNPFSVGMNISFNLSEASYSDINVYDLQGREVARPLSEYLGAGVHQVSWVPESSLPSGEYIVVMNALETRVSRTVVLLR